MAEQETNVEEQEIVIETEAEVEEKVEVEEPEKEEPDKSSGDEELDSYSKGVQSRIKKLTEKYRQEERDKTKDSC